ncbi:MAG: type IV secretion system DNA-binding domain-containing protein [Patescibacteria group bacterium]|jgi:CxxC-x17-CxxC domain-containing protein|nr:type IV secretion system DNA-binding domain-containing protein [Patescibacteria group bacterium]
MAEENKNKIVYFAETNFRNIRTKFGIKQDDRRRHTYIIGKTGMGKSTMMENMIIQDIVNGEGVALVDPHGDFAEKILDFIPSYRVNDIVYLNPADIQYPVAFNVMESVSQEHKHLIASGLVGVFKKLWADSWGPRLEYLLRNAILALLDYPGSTLLGVMRILVDKNYRKKVIEKIQDPVVKSFWVEEFSKYPQQFQVEAIAPIQNKVGQFLSTALIRNVVGQVKSSFDLREVMDNQKILILNLSKGRIGEDSSALLGAMMITKIQLAAMSRIDTPEENRKDFYLYVDEFQNFATESFATILSEARKYRLNLTIGHQYIEQLDETVSAAVFGNVGTIVCFRVGATDAEALETEFAPYFTPEDLVNLAKYDIYLKLMIDGIASNPFSATTLPPLGETFLTNNRSKVINVSRERYARPRDVVEDKISRWHSVEINIADTKQVSISKEPEKKDNQPPTVLKTNPPRHNNDRGPSQSTGKDNDKSNRNKKRKEKKTYTVNCYECGQPTEVTFKPDGLRPIYCQKCFQNIKSELITGEIPGKIEEVKSQNPQPEISLQEAISTPPQLFEKTNRPNESEQSQQSGKPPTAKKITLHELVEKKLATSAKPSSAPISPENQSAEDETPEVKNIKPGQVVKF